MKKSKRHRIKVFLKHPAVAALINTALLILVGILSSDLCPWTCDNLQSHGFEFFGFIATIVAYISETIFYGTEKVNDRRLSEMSYKEAKTYESFASNSIYINSEVADGVNDCISGIIENGVVDLNRWNFDKASRLLCKIIYSSICNLRDNKGFGVSYVRLCEDRNVPAIYMNSYANENSSAPNIFKKVRPLNIDDIEAYHDIELFRDGNSEINILPTPESIQRAFCIPNRAGHTGTGKKYKQYIGIPVVCAQKMIGLVQVVCYNDVAKFGITEDEIREFAKKYLVPYAYTFLLLNKIEDALTAKPNATSEMCKK